MDRTVNDVPDTEVAFVVAVMTADGLSVTKTRQPDGRWTVVGVSGQASPPPASAASERGPAPGPATTAGQALAADVLARTLWGEARGEGKAGMEAVACVILNRVQRQQGRWGLTVEEVCRKPRQFSCWNLDDPNRPRLLAVGEADADFASALEISERAVRGGLTDVTRGSTHYHTRSVHPDWSAGKVPAFELGAHLFFNDIS